MIVGAFNCTTLTHEPRGLLDLPFWNPVWTGGFP
jgi:hypothetical protein